MNGRAEAEVGYLSRATKTLLVEAELPDSMWPLALRHAAERRLQLQLAEVKMPTQDLLPFGSYGYARQKDWNEKTRAWRRSRVKVRILGTDATIWLRPSHVGRAAVEGAGWRCWCQGDAAPW